MRNKFLIGGLAAFLAVWIFSFMPKKECPASKTGTPSEMGIRFIEDDWKKALSEARAQQKPIFLDAYASWCGPCKMLKRNTFPDKAAGDFFNAHFINVAVDMEKGDGPALSEQYSVGAYPTLIITDPEGKIITYTQGYINARQLIEFGQHGLGKFSK